MELTLQIFDSEHWQDAAKLTLDPSSRQVSLVYLQDYALAHLYARGETALSVNFPVELFNHHRFNGLPAFLEDILPSGASRRYWVNRLGIAHLSGWEQVCVLLEKAVISPIGNLRIKESQVALTERERALRFSPSDVHLRQADFLDYAQSLGAMSGSASGAGGEAPKLLVRMDAQGLVWIDANQSDSGCLDAHYLVKFPRGKATQRDKEILRTEYAYLKALDNLGVQGIDAQKAFLMDEEDRLSLWLPRFDVERLGGRLRHLGMESIFSVMEKPAGSDLNHLDVVQQVCGRLEGLSGFDPQAFVREWVKRDFLNVVFANADNHGRNSAFLKSTQGIRLSPVYDFAPMRADPEGIVRSIRWPRPLEVGSEFDWQGIAQALAPWAPPEVILQMLMELSARLLGLKGRLLALGAPADFLEVPALGLNHLDERLAVWGLV